MPRSFGVIFIVALIVWALLGVLAGQALGNHVQCGDVITQDTTLDSDLLDCPGDGIVIGAEGITLDLNGYTVDGDGGPSGLPGCDTGIVNGRWDNCTRPPNQPGHGGVTVRNGTVREFPSGVQLQEANGYALLRLRISDSRGPAVSIFQSSHGLIKDNVVFGAVGVFGSGMLLSESSGSSIEGNVLSGNAGFGMEFWDTNDLNRIEGNVVARNAGGIFMRGTRDTLLARNRVIANRGIGMDVSDGFTRNRIEANRIADNGGPGMWLYEGVHDNQIDLNVLLRNGNGGIGLWEGEENQIRKNRVSENGGDGVVVDGGGRGNVINSNDLAGNSANGILLTNRFLENTVIALNRARRNGADGINIGGDVTGTVVRRNLANRNGDDGIDVANSQTALFANSAHRNVDLGIEAVAGSVDGGGNRAAGNGNPLQCLNVFCR